MARAGFKRQPSFYPRPAFHAIRTGQVISSVIVMSILGYFVYWLSHDNYYVPWTFILLLSVSSFTNVSIVITAYFYYMRVLKPGLSVYINGFLTVLWMLGFALLTYNLSSLLSNRCDIEHWDHETGVMICRIYKALETFSITGMLFTAAAFLLDVRTLRASNRLGVYNQMNPGDIKRPVHTRAISSHDDFSISMGDVQHGYRKPSLEFPEYSHEVKRPYRVQKTIEAQNFGYAAPSEQTTYDGAGARALDRDFENRA